MWQRGPKEDPAPEIGQETVEEVRKLPGRVGMPTAAALSRLHALLELARPGDPTLDPLRAWMRFCPILRDRPMSGDSPVRSHYQAQSCCLRRNPSLQRKPPNFGIGSRRNSGRDLQQASPAGR